MKRNLLILVALVFTACSVIEIEESTSLQKEAIRETLRLKSADSLFYHTQSGRPLHEHKSVRGSFAGKCRNVLHPKSN